MIIPHMRLLINLSTILSENINRGFSNMICLRVLSPQSPMTTPQTSLRSQPDSKRVILLRRRNTTSTSHVHPSPPLPSMGKRWIPSPRTFMTTGSTRSIILMWFRTPCLKAIPQRSPSTIRPTPSRFVWYHHSSLCQSRRYT